MVWSALSLLYPLAAALYVWLATPASIIVILGYGLANLGYLLVAITIIKKPFPILRLKNRKQTAIAAVIAWVLGTALINL